MLDAILPQRQNPTVRAALSLVSLLSRSMLAADEIREEEQRAGGGPKDTSGLTIGEVIKGAGLHIPDLQDAIANLMGGKVEGQEAAAVADLATQHPDLGKFLAALALKIASASATSPANGAPLAHTTPAAAAGKPTPPKYRADLAREPAADAGAPRPPSTSPLSTPPAPSPEPSVLAAVEQRLRQLQHRLEARADEHDARLRRLEADLKELCERVKRIETALAQRNQPAEQAPSAPPLPKERPTPAERSDESPTSSAPLPSSLPMIDEIAGAMDQRLTDDDARMSVIEHDVDSIRAVVLALERRCMEPEPVPEAGKGPG